MNEQKKSIGEFIVDFILKHFVWLVPIVVLIAFWKPVLFVIYIPFLVTYIYSSWMKYDKEWNMGQKLVVVKFSKRITYLYYAATLLFLFLTMIATYIGMTKVFAMEKDGFWVALGISFGVPLALFAIVMITKARKTPTIFVMAFILYILFDGLVALPFNFLFFYDHLAKCERLEKDELYFQTVIDDCDSIIAPKAKNFGTVYTQLTDTTVTSVKKDFYRQGKDVAMNQLNEDKSKGYLTDEEAEKERRRINNTFSSSKNANSNQKTFQKKEVNIKAANDSLKFYNTLQVKIDSCKNLQNKLADESKLDNKMPYVNQIRTLLSETCNESKVPFLQSKVKSLRAEKQSSINSIKGFYEWLIQIVKGEMRKDMTIIMSFSMSFVIDILPLLLSLFYIMYKRND